MLERGGRGEGGRSGGGAERGKRGEKMGRGGVVVKRAMLLGN